MAAFSIAKLLEGFKFWEGEKFGKILYQVIIWALCSAAALGVWYKLFYQRTTATTHHAENITNITRDSDSNKASLLELKLGLFNFRIGD
jgi:hypothetical protein